MVLYLIHPICEGLPESLFGEELLWVRVFEEARTAGEFSSLSYPYIHPNRSRTYPYLYIVGISAIAL
jgi:hypothetical protein